ncbi:hypothetical protein MC885_001271 [Smutsia gigantea]|nr:hypothetical protein MC885_001271 [Smutsia gigantea]
MFGFAGSVLARCPHRPGVYNLQVNKEFDDFASSVKWNSSRTLHKDHSPQSGVQERVAASRQPIPTGVCP